MRIENLRNIKKCDINFRYGKINVFYGVNGGGKSTIARAIADDPTLIKSSYLYDGETIIDVEGEKFGEIMLHDEKSKNKIIVEKNHDNLVTLIIADEVEMQKLIDEINNVVSQETLNKLNNTINNLNKPKLLDVNKSGSLYKFKNQLNSSKDFNLLYSKISYEDKNKVTKWIYDGVNYHLNEEKTDLIDECLFCRNAISKDRKKEILSIPKTRSVLNKRDEVLNFIDYTHINIDLSTTELSDKEKAELNILKTELNDLINLRKVLTFNLNFNNLSDIEQRLDSANSGEKRSVYKKYGILEEIDSTMSNLKINIQQYKDAIIQYKRETNSIMKKSVKEINDYLHRVGFKYKFSVKLDDESLLNKDNAQFYLVPNRSVDVKVDDYNDTLSYGEKNVLSLVYTLVNQKAETIIIDDPISSYDIGYKTQLIDLIFEFSRSNDSKTILLFTHDSVLTKLACQKNRQDENLIRHIYNNSGTIELTSIVNSDFKLLLDQLNECDLANKLSFFIKYRLYVQTLLLSDQIKKLDDYDNLESFSTSKELLYSFLSFKMHLKSSVEINESLSKIKCEWKDEHDIAKIEDVEKAFHELGCSGINVGYLNAEINIEDDYSNASSAFDKLLILREFQYANGDVNFKINKIKSKLSPEVIGVLNGYVHMLELEVYNINVFKFNILHEFMNDLLMEVQNILEND